jgi:hypothetical protein
LNTFEIAILRILIKRNQYPITIHSLIEGFPDGSENCVIDALSNLIDSKFISKIYGEPLEEEYIVYNLEKKNEILKIIDPLQEMKISTVSNKSNGVKVNTEIKQNKIQNSLINPIRILMSIIFIVSIGATINAMPTANDTIRVFDANFHSHHLKYGGEAYGNNDKSPHPKPNGEMFTDLSLYDDNNNPGSASWNLPKPNCHRT